MRNKYDTYYVKKVDLKKEWFVIDVKGCTLGRIATKIAHILRGKHKPLFQTSQDNGDNVVVVNADKIKVTGSKHENKIYYWYTGYPGGIKSRNFSKMQQEKPERIIYLAVKRMLPKGRLGRQMLKKMFIYAGEEHKHEAQKLKKIG